MPRRKTENQDAPLNPRQIRFVDHLLAGMSQCKAYALAYNHDDPQKHRTSASELANQPHVKKYLDHRRELESREASRRRIMDRAKKEEILSEIATSGGSEARDRISAIKVHNAMSGDDAPKKVEHSVSILGVIAQINGGHDDGFLEDSPPEIEAESETLED